MKNPYSWAKSMANLGTLDAKCQALMLQLGNIFYRAVGPCLPSSNHRTYTDLYRVRTCFFSIVSGAGSRHEDVYSLSWLTYGLWNRSWHGKFPGPSNSPNSLHLTRFSQPKAWESAQTSLGLGEVRLELRPLEGWSWGIWWIQKASCLGV